jgi:two-component system chemotaxis sensor kinase CheA
MEDQLIDQEELQEIIGEFIIESVELVDAAIRDIVRLEEEPSSQTVNSVFRAVHTIKGTSGFLGFTALSGLAHKAEDVLSKVRKGEIGLSPDVINLILKSLDVMKLLVEDIGAQGKEARDIEHLLAELGTIEKKHEQTLNAVHGADEGRRIARGKAGAGTMKQAAPPEPGAGNDGQQSSAMPKKEQTVRVDVKKLDELMNLVGELVLGKNRLVLLNALFKEGETARPALESLAEGTNYIETITNNLQAAVMRARLVPISRLFNKVPRLVRDLCSISGKEVQLIIEGGETELDKSLIETLHDPLTHIMRNSIDHGIESPEERRRNGKATKGVVSVKAWNEGNRVAIEVLDDGRGIDVKAIKEKIIERGFLPPGEAERLSAEEAINYIFVPGFSTAKELTSVSGRGVGMDVVKTNIERMNGQVCVESRKGEFTKLTISLPLTLAIIKALLVSVGNELYAIPADVVLEVIKPKEALVKTVQGHELLLLQELTVPLVRLSDIVSCPSDPGEECSVVLCKAPGRPVGIRVGSVAGQEEVVIKSLGEFLKGVPWIAGATIRGDGRVVLILDLAHIVEHFVRQPFAA